MAAMDGVLTDLQLPNPGDGAGGDEASPIKPYGTSRLSGQHPVQLLSTATGCGSRDCDKGLARGQGIAEPGLTNAPSPPRRRPKA